MIGSVVTWCITPNYSGSDTPRVQPRDTVTWLVTWTGPTDLSSCCWGISVYSLKGKKVCFLELTSPAEENIRYWQLVKRKKYLDLVEEAKSHGFSACCRTIEVGARGFVSKNSLNVFTMLGINFRKRDVLRRELSRVAIRCSHFIWINRENKSWGSPNRIF